MARRSTHHRFDESRSQETSAVAAYAAQSGWRIGRRNLLVEGTTDVGYFELASSLFAEHHGQRLLDDQFRVVAAGLYDRGGVRGVVREMLSLHGRAEIDSSLPKSARIRMLPIFDDDCAGRRCFTKLTDADFPFRPYQDVFLLHRAYPNLKLGSSGYLDAVRKANHEWNGLDCEIEDLLSQDLLDGFCDNRHDALRAPPCYLASGHHYDFHGNCKGDVLKFAQQVAGLADVVGLVRTLQYYRRLFDLPIGPYVV